MRRRCSSRGKNSVNPFHPHLASPKIGEGLFSSLSFSAGPREEPLSPLPSWEGLGGGKPWTMRIPHHNPDFHGTSAATSPRPIHSILPEKGEVKQIRVLLRTGLDVEQVHREVD
jgi:hypothetical protein